jgi:hypothetical protein
MQTDAYREVVVVGWVVETGLLLPMDLILNSIASFGPRIELV